MIKIKKWHKNVCVSAPDLSVKAVQDNALEQWQIKVNQLAESIYEMHIGDNAFLEINISSEARDAVKEAFEIARSVCFLYDLWCDLWYMMCLWCDLWSVFWYMMCSVICFLIYDVFCDLFFIYDLWCDLFFYIWCVLWSVFWYMMCSVMFVMWYMICFFFNFLMWFVIWSIYDVFCDVCDVFFDIWCVLWCVLWCDLFMMCLWCDVFIIWCVLAWIWRCARCGHFSVQSVFGGSDSPVGLWHFPSFPMHRRISLTNLVIKQRWYMINDDLCVLVS